MYLDKDILTKDEKDWFGDRMDESHTGRILIPKRLYEKFRNITGASTATNAEIKCWLIDNAYN